MHYLPTFCLTCLCVTSGEPREQVTFPKIEYLLKLFATLLEEVITSSLRNTDLVWTPESQQHGQCSQHLCGEGVETVCAQGIRAGMHHLQEAAAPVKCPANVGLFWGALQAPFPGLLLPSSWKERQMRNWQLEGLELLQEVVGRQKRATDGEKPEEGMNDTSGHHLVVLALPLCLEELLYLQVSLVAATSLAHFSLPKQGFW